MKLSSDDLMVVLALCREGTLERAGQFLSRDASSVFRAIKRIEAKVGSPLFERSKAGFQPFPVAEELAGKGRSISAALSEADAICSEIGDVQSGKLRVTTTDVLLEHVILPNMGALRQMMPQLSVQFSISNQVMQLWERGFDLAIRPSSNPPDQLLGQCLKRFGYVAACATDYEQSAQAQRGDFSKLNWLVPGGALKQHPIRKGLAEQLKSAASILSFDSMNLMLEGVHLGLGVAVIPDLAPLTRGLVRLDMPMAQDSTELWSLYHPSNRGNLLLQGFTKFVKTALAET